MDDKQFFQEAGIKSTRHPGDAGVLILSRVFPKIITMRYYKHPITNEYRRTVEITAEDLLDLCRNQILPEIVEEDTIDPPPAG